MSNVARYLFVGPLKRSAVRRHDAGRTASSAPSPTSNVGDGELMGLVTERLVGSVRRRPGSEQDEVAFNSHHNALRGLGRRRILRRLRRARGGAETSSGPPDDDQPSDEGPAPRHHRPARPAARPYFKKRRRHHHRRSTPRALNDAAAVVLMASERQSAQPSWGWSRWPSSARYHNVGVHREYMGVRGVQGHPPPARARRNGPGRHRLLRDQRGLRRRPRRQRSTTSAGPRPGTRTNQWGQRHLPGDTRSAAPAARQVVDMIHQLHRRGGKIGVTTRCVGGGIGSGEVLSLP